MSLAPTGVDREVFAADVREHLLRSPRELPSKYFYDALGSALFDAICHLPWYRITRAEAALLDRHAQDILAPLRGPLSLCELGCGNGEKLARFVAASGAEFERIELIDISPAALAAARRQLESLHAGPVAAHHGTYEQGLSALQPADGDRARLVLFLGSNIGNFMPAEAHALLARIRGGLRRGDALLLGTDLVKPEPELVLAYDDPLGVTGAFNLNLLRRINDELGGTFDLSAWRHRAVWDASEQRIEMHLVSTAAQRVRILSAGLNLAFAEGESIRTERSHKYRPRDVLAAGTAAGFTGGDTWIDRSAGFALTRFTV